MLKLVMSQQLSAPTLAAKCKLAQGFFVQRVGNAVRTTLPSSLIKRLAFVDGERSQLYNTANALALDDTVSDPSYQNHRTDLPGGGRLQLSEKLTHDNSASEASISDPCVTQQSTRPAQAGSTQWTRGYSAKQHQANVEEERADAVVIGAGVVGLAIARQLALSGREVLILEADTAFGTGTSSRSSEVIHGGLYYQVGSLKAQLSVQGNKMLYQYAREHDVNHNAIGKLVVASSEQELPKLSQIHDNATANGCSGVEWISVAEANNLESNVRCVGALLSKSTGIIDSHGLMAALLADAEAHGAVLAANSMVTGGQITNDGINLEVTDSTELRDAKGTPVPPTMRLKCATVVNAAGLDAQAIAKSLTNFPADLVPRRYLARGNYFSFSGGKSPFSRLVYPIPPEGGLGVHVTVDLGGQCKFGPDVEWLPEQPEHPGARYDYTVDPSRAATFYSAIRNYYPDLPEGSLEPAYAGIRPKLFGPGQADVGSTDFLIQGQAEHGVAGLVNLFGIESPGLTSCLAIAEHVAKKLEAQA